MGAKVAIITDPPTTVVRPRHGTPQMGGSFLAVVTLQRILQEKGYEVQTYTFFSDDSVVELSDYVHSLGVPHREDMPLTRIAALAARDEFRAFILSLRSERIPVFLSRLLDLLDTRASRPFVFVTAGPKSAEAIKQLASGHRAPVHILERPGVARITRKGRNYVLQTLERIGSTVPAI